MPRPVNIFTFILAVASVSTLNAQTASKQDFEKLNTNLGIMVSVPLNPTARFVSLGWGLVAGAGYNINKRNSLIGELMWNRLYASDGALEPLRSALQARDISGRSDLVALTGNYRFEVQRKTYGAYVIGGGGWYYRRESLSRHVTTTEGVVCDPGWLWWGFTCVSGTVTTNQTLGSTSSNAFGGNVGVGFTRRVGEPPYRMYVESRYHYAPTKNVNTQLVAITVGIRY